MMIILLSTQTTNIVDCVYGAYKRRNQSIYLHNKQKDLQLG